MVHAIKHRNLFLEDLKGRPIDRVSRMDEKGEYIYINGKKIYYDTVSHSFGKKYYIKGSNIIKFPEW